ncbi:MAG: hypothetical protein ACE5E1_08070 [Phycisphaerae bacterium]
MEAGTTDIADLSLPADDGAIARAIDRLDARLEAWASLVATFQNRLDDCAKAQSAASVKPPEDKDQDQEFREVEASTPGEHGVDSAPGVAAERDEPEPGTSEAQPSQEMSERELEALLSTMEPETANAVRIRRELLGSEIPLRDLIEQCEREAEEAEALLEALAPEMAADIRVQYRFHSGRKSIRELIEEYEVESRPEKKSWWKRVKG